MAGYDPSRDQTLWVCPEMSADGLIVSIKVYVPENQQGGKVKLDFSRRSEYNGQVQYKGGGRLTLDDLAFLHKHWNGIIAEMMKYAPQGYQPKPPLPAQPQGY